MSFWNPFCSCQRQTKVSTINDDFVQHENQLNSNLFQHGIQRIYVRGDGNCLFYALTYGLIEAMRNERNGFAFRVQKYFPLSVELHPKDFADRLRQISVEQLKSKSNFYRQFVATNRRSFDDEIEKFAFDGVYDSALGDIVPLTIANALNVQIIILTSLPHLSKIDVKPMKGQTTTGIPLTTIFLAYNQYGLGHYDAAYPRY